MSRLNRREFLRLGGTAATQAVVGSSLFALACDYTPYGSLEPPDVNGLRLPAGFRSRILARQGDPVAGTGHIWHAAPDGGATFPLRDGWIYVSNSELPGQRGGVGALQFDRNGAIVAAYSILRGTNRNCAGGATPWGTWLSCEEVRDGLVWECDPTGQEAAQLRPALGRFNHEAVAVDPIRKHLYLTEDRFDSGFYRFTPNTWPRLDGGVLEVAEVDGDGRVRWHALPNPVPDHVAGEVPTRHQVPGSAVFRGGEGIVFDAQHIFFTTKFDNRVWDYDPAEERIRILYQADQDPLKQLSGVDNITAAADSGDLIVAEDGGNMELVSLSPDGLALPLPLLRVEGQARSELT